MRVLLRRLFAAALAVLVASPAWAGTGTITVLDSASVTRTYDVITDGSGHFVDMVGICDGTAAAQCAAVKAASTAAVATDPALVVAISPNNTVAATQSGTWNVTNVSGTVSLPTGAATAAKQPALGTAGTPSADVITIQGVTSMTAVKVDGSAVTQPVSGTVSLGAGGNTIGTVNIGTSGVAQGSTTSGQNVALIGCATENVVAAGTNAQTNAAVCDLRNQLIVTPNAPVAKQVTGSGSQTSTTATTIIAAQGVGVKIYVTDLECSNSGSTNSTVSLNDTATSVFPNPSTFGGFMKSFSTPLVVAANTALQFTPSAGSTTQVCNAQGFVGP